METGSRPRFLCILGQPPRRRIPCSYPATGAPGQVRETGAGAVEDGTSISEARVDEQLPRGHSAKWHSNRGRAPRCVCKQPLPEKQALVMFGDRDEGLPRVPHSRERTHPVPLVHGSCTAAHKPSQGNTLRPQAATHVHASPSSASSGEIFTVSKTMGCRDVRDTEQKAANKHTHG